MSIAKIVENIESMRELFEISGFKQVKLFKGLGGIDEKTFYLVTTLSPGEEEKDYLSCARKTRQLEEKLQDLLGCYVHVSRESAMDPDALEIINMPGNSVNLLEPEKAVVQEELENYFGTDWLFNKTDPYIERDSEESIPQKNIATTPLSRNFFAPPLTEKKASNKSVQKIEDLVAQLNKLKNELTGSQLDFLLEKVSECVKPNDERPSQSQ